MDCCSNQRCAGTNRFFSRWSRTYAKRARRKGLEKVQRYLLEGIEANDVQAVLDIGCGVGSLHMALLERGAARAVGIDLAEGMLEEARTLAKERGLEDRTEYVHGDFVAEAGNLPEADVTLLDKVVCCYENLSALIEQSTLKTRRLYGLVHPRDSVFPRWFFKIQIFLSRLFRAQFQPFWHDWRAMNAMIAARGFRLRYERPTIMWTAVVFERVQSSNPRS